MGSDDNCPRPAFDEMALVGSIARAHGIRGQVIVNPETDFPEARFQPGAELFIERNGAVEPIRVTTLRFHRQRPIIGIDGIETMDDAETLAGRELRVPVGWLAPLPAETYYRHDLVGCEVQDTRGEMLGRVTGVEGSLDRSYLVVDGHMMVPLVGDICVAIDIAGRRVTIDPPDGLVDLNRGHGTTRNNTEGS